MKKNIFIALFATLIGSDAFALSYTCVLAPGQNNSVAVKLNIDATDKAVSIRSSTSSVVGKFKKVSDANLSDAMIKFGGWNENDFYVTLTMPFMATKRIDARPFNVVVSKQDNDSGAPLLRAGFLCQDSNYRPVSF
ncbi:MAG TPA: hypothetical protein VNJ01_10530 [Bacteriovoracaceae bacterium]|nr:hypothetical protein [Bacteriovoracaceae bacterium]